MGIIERRLERLEDRSRATAAAEVHRAFDTFSDNELALFLAPYYFKRDPSTEEVSAYEAVTAAIPEDLISRTIGFHEDLPAVEVSRRMKGLTDPILERRRAGIRRQYEKHYQKETP